MKSKKILVYSNGEAIGDGIYKLNFLTTLKNNFPSYKIFWLTSGPTAYQGSLKKISHAFIEKVFTEYYGKKKLRDIFFTPDEIKNTYFDIIIDTQKSPIRSTLLKKLPHGLFVSGCLNFLLSDLKPKHKLLTNSLNAYLINLIQLLARHEEKDLLDYPFKLSINKIYQIELNRLLPRKFKYIGFAPGAADLSKVWLLDNFIAVATYYSKKAYIPVFFIGPNELAWLDLIKKKLPNARFPEIELKERKKNNGGIELVVAIANRMQINLANDSGMSHMIALSNSYLLSLFSKHDPAKYAALTKKITVIDSKSFGGTNPNLISVKYVIKKMNEILKAL